MVTDASLPDRAACTFTSRCLSIRAMAGGRQREAEQAVAALIETYRHGFVHLAPEQIASIWDTQHEPLIYVAQEMKEPTYGWPAIQRYLAALPEHLEKVLAKEVKDL